MNYLAYQHFNVILSFSDNLFDDAYIIFQKNVDNF